MQVLDAPELFDLNAFQAYHMEDVSVLKRASKRELAVLIHPAEEFGLAGVAQGVELA